MSSFEDNKTKLTILRNDENFDLILSCNGITDITGKIVVAEPTISGLSKQLDILSESLFRLKSRSGRVGNLSVSNDIPFNTMVSDMGNLIYTLFLNQVIREQILQLSGGTFVISSNDYSIPWEIMYDGKEYLCLKFLMSRKIHIHYKKTENIRQLSPEKFKILFVADPREDLPEAREEVNSIVKVLEKNGYFNIDILEGKSINRIQLLSKICDYDFFVVLQDGLTFSLQ